MQYPVSIYPIRRIAVPRKAGVLRCRPAEGRRAEDAAPLGHLCTCIALFAIAFRGWLGHLRTCRALLAFACAATRPLMHLQGSIRPRLLRGCFAFCAPAGPYSLSPARRCRRNDHRHVEKRLASYLTKQSNATMAFKCTLCNEILLYRLSRAHSLHSVQSNAPISSDLSDSDEFHCTFCNKMP